MRSPARVRRTPEPASVVCPDCGGVLSVHTQGDAEHLLFVCQVGHSFSVTALLSGKEARLEEVLWSLADLLADLAARGGPDGSQPTWRPGRDNERIDLGHGVTAERDTA